MATTAGLPPDLLDTTPAMYPPDGSAPNFVDPPSLFTVALISMLLCLIFATAFFVVRVITKCFLLKKLDLEDYNIAIGWVFFVVFITLIIDVNNHGGGRHTWDVTINQAISFVNSAVNIETMYAISMCFCKVALLQQIRRIFVGTKRGLVFNSTTALVYINVGFFFAIICANIWSCKPREAEWDPLVTGVCINYRSLLVISCGINLVSDIAVLVIPLACIWRLVMPFKQKLAVGAVFATGIFSCTAAVARLVMSVPILTSEDIVWVLTPIGLWAAAELSTVIMCSCMPFIPRFLQACGIQSAAGLSTSQESGKSAGGLYSTSRSNAMNEKEVLAVASDEETIAGSIARPAPVGRMVSNRSGQGFGATALVAEDDGSSSADEGVYQQIPNVTITSPTSAVPPQRPAQPMFARGGEPLTSVEEGHDQARPSSAPSNPFTSSSDSPGSEEHDGRPTARPHTSSRSPSPSNRPRFSHAPPEQEAYEIDGTSPTPLNPEAVEIEDTSPAPAPIPKRVSSLSDRASTPTGQRTMSALAGKFWKNAEDEERCLSRGDSLRREEVRRRVEGEWLAKQKQKEEGDKARRNRERDERKMRGGEREQARG